MFGAPSLRRVLFCCLGLALLFQVEAVEASGSAEVSPVAATSTTQTPSPSIAPPSAAEPAAVATAKMPQSVSGAKVHKPAPPKPLLPSALTLCAAAVVLAFLWWVELRRCVVWLWVRIVYRMEPKVRWSLLTLFASAIVLAFPWWPWLWSWVTLVIRDVNHKPIEALTMFGTLATALIILIQDHLLRVQSQVSALIELQRQWESRRMRNLRTRWAKDSKQMDGLEPILEFLEDFAGLRRRRVMSNKLIWDSTLGWHAARYYFYNMDKIKEIRHQWKDDETIFQNLEKVLWPAYLKKEKLERRLDAKQIEQEMEKTKSLFIKAEEEEACDARCIPEGSD